MSTVLIVDDDPGIRKLLCKTLQREGITVIEAKNGIECMEHIQTQTIDLVVIDIIMPQQDGLTTIAELKKNDCHAKVVAISGGLVLTSDAYLEEAQRIGADRIIPKPIDREQFVAMVRQLLNG
ncbi:Response regulator receiver protein [Desulfosarcina cetonica]|uniref:response regulator n=1 Tax=Desulfosarcina cetonica TaxID=90730 RepID=UPI0006D2172D|nr:response regulator [Desulfosarcina cetonica]VTR66494.1 Response regulator receiver protein [Desulfosarcina cetonica]